MGDKFSSAEVIRIQEDEKIETKKRKRSSNKNVPGRGKLNTMCMYAVLPELGIIMFGSDSRQSTYGPLDLDELIKYENDIADCRKRMRGDVPREYDIVNPRRTYPSVKGNLKISSDFQRKVMAFGPFWMLNEGSQYAWQKLCGFVCARYKELYANRKVPTLLEFVNLVGQQIEKMKENEPNPIRWEFNNYLVGSVVIKNNTFRDYGCYKVISFSLAEATHGKCTRSELMDYAAIGSGTPCVTAWLNGERWKDVSNVEEAKAILVDAMSEATSRKDTCGGCLEIFILTVDEEGGLREERLFNLPQVLCNQFGIAHKESQFRSPWNQRELLEWRSQVNENGENFTLRGKEEIQKPIFNLHGEYSFVEKEKREIMNKKTKRKIMKKMNRWKLSRSRLLGFRK